MGENVAVKVVLRNPNRELEVAGPMSVKALMARLGVEREAVLVIVDGTLVTDDTVVGEESTVEVRPVISGGGV